MLYIHKQNSTIFVFILDYIIIKYRKHDSRFEVGQQIVKKFWYMLIPQQQPNHNKVKIIDLVLLSLFMRDNVKCNISYDP